VHIALAERELAKAGVPGGIVVDCSHANSNKDPTLQPLVLDNVANQIVEGNRSIVGVMLESNLAGGNQSIPADLSQLRYGVSVTDGCLDWESTAGALRAMREKLRDVLPGRKKPD
jgi:3-deoxy-7-phosphoheptulonate synthase